MLQGSKLGPILFTSYSAPASDVIRKHDMEDEKYAEDEHIYNVFSPTFAHDQRNALNKMNKCISDLKNFMKKKN